MKLRDTVVLYLIVMPVVSALMWMACGYELGLRLLLEPALVAVGWWLVWVVARCSSWSPRRETSSRRTRMTSAVLGPNDTTTKSAYLAFLT